MNSLNYYSSAKLSKYLMSQKTDEQLYKMLHTLLLQNIGIQNKVLEAILLKLPPQIAKKFEIDFEDKLLYTKLKCIALCIKKYNCLSTSQNYYNLSEFEDANIVLHNFLIKMDLADIVTVSLFEDYENKD